MSNLWGYTHKLLTTKNISFTFSNPQFCTLKFQNFNCQKKGIFINDNYFNKSINKVSFPFPMHPNMYTDEISKLIVSNRKNEKRILIFFAGNTSKVEYSRDSILEQFGLINRYKLIQSIKKNFSKRLWEPVFQKNTPNCVLNYSLSNMIVLIESTNFSLSIHDYLSYLSQSAFFIGAPGVKMPFCHNLIEALSLGTIPILEFPELFNPPLEHEKNCLVFKGEDGFLEVIEDILSGKFKATIKSMSNNARMYFEDNLDPAKIIKEIESNKKVSEIYLNTEDTSISYLL